MIESSEKSAVDQNRLDEHRAADEGMGTAIGAPAAVENPEQEPSLVNFLDQVLAQFHKHPALGLVEVAVLVADTEPGMKKFASEIRHLKRHLLKKLKPEGWEELSVERTKRRLQADKTLGGTPG
jgi:hypothetical protein